MSQSTRSSTSKRAMKERIFKGRSIVRCCFCRLRLYMSNATLEHIQPLSRGGDWTRDNLTLSCAGCNNERGSEDFETFRVRKRAVNGQPNNMRSNQETSV